jgi:hypothetical protein
VTVQRGFGKMHDSLSLMPLKSSTSTTPVNMSVNWLPPSTTKTKIKQLPYAPDGVTK